MRILNDYWKRQNQKTALRDLRRDPHLAKDIGLSPINPGPTVDKIFW